MQSAGRVADDGLARFQSERVLAVDLFLSAIDVGADPEVDADGAGVKIHAFLAVVHVLEVFLEEGEVDNFAGNEVGVVEGGGEGFGVAVRAVTLNAQVLLDPRVQLCEEMGRKEASTNLRRYHQRPWWSRNSQTRWCRKDHLGSRKT